MVDALAHRAHAAHAAQLAGVDAAVPLAGLVQSAVRVDGALGVAADLRVAEVVVHARADRSPAQHQAVRVGSAGARVAWVERWQFCNEYII